MNTASSKLVDDLAAHWTDPALEILKAAGVSAVSIDMELETWRTLREILQAELRWQRAFRFSTLVSLGTVMEEVLRDTILAVAQKFAPQALSFAFDRRVQQSVRDRRATASERRLYAELVREPALKAAFKPPTRTDYFPRLRVSAAG